MIVNALLTDVKITEIFDMVSVICTTGDGEGTEIRWVVALCKIVRIGYLL
jgi:hypothetical protein